MTETDRSTVRTETGRGSLRVLHLGFEDPAMPGAGGGSLRTHEINRRLVADGMDVTVLATRFPGCVDRVQDGVRYVHVGAGPSGSRRSRLLGYVFGLPAAVRRHTRQRPAERRWWAPTRRAAVGAVIAASRWRTSERCST